MAIDFAHNRIIRGDVDEPITRWGVWFKTPFGYVETVDEMLEVCEKAQIDPNLTTFAVPVAFTANTHEVHER